MVRYNLGSGSDILSGYVNADLRFLPGVDIVTDLTSPVLPRMADEVFSNAFFEHLYRAERVNHLIDVYNQLGPGGFINYQGIPWFPGIANAYLKGLKGTMMNGTVFDLYHVYRYTHGAPDESDHYLAQLHKGLFDYDEINNIVAAAGIPLQNVAIYTYSYPGEPTDYHVTCGFHITNNTYHTADDHENEVMDYLALKPQYVNHDTVCFQ